MLYVIRFESQNNALFRQHQHSTWLHSGKSSSDKSKYLIGSPHCLNFTKSKNKIMTMAQYFHHHHHQHVHEGLGVFPGPWSSKWSWSLHLFFGRPMFLRLLVCILVLFSFMIPCIINQWIKYQLDAKILVFISLIVLLYMFRASHPPIIRSAKNVQAGMV